MNRRKFVELLNLYIDGEIDPEDLSRLETKIGRDAEARRIYHQYCRLHRGTRLVYERFREQAPPKMVPNRNRTGFLGWFPARRLGRLSIAASGMAAAIILVSGSVLLMQPGEKDEMVEEIALTPIQSAVSVAAVAPVIQSFSAETEFSEFVPASTGSVVPASWNPEISLRRELLTQKVIPVAWPASSDINWEVPAPITYPTDVPVRGDYRVYRSREPKFLWSDSIQPVAFQFRK